MSKGVLHREAKLLSDDTSLQWALIPGLPEELGINCLARVSRIYHPQMKGVCRSWRNMLSDHTSEIFEQRDQEGLAEPSLLSVFLSQPSSYAEKAFIVEVKELHLASGKVSQAKYHTQKDSGKEGKEGEDSCLLNWKYSSIWNGTHVGILARSVMTSSVNQNPFYTIDLFNKRGLKRAADMKIPRVDFELGVIDGFLYVAGGYSVQGYRFIKIQSVERYDFRNDSWNSVSEMPFCLTLLHSTVKAGRLVLIGENEGKYHCISYHARSDLWEVQGNSIYKEMERLSMLPCVVPVPSNPTGFDMETGISRDWIGISWDYDFWFPKVLGIHKGGTVVVLRAPHNKMQVHCQENGVYWVSSPGSEHLEPIVICY